MDINMNETNVGNSITMTIPKNDYQDVQWCTRCLVCDESIPVYSPFEREYKICDKCKRAILKMRECMKED